MVHDITFSDKEILGPTKDHRTAIVDILCNADQEDHFIIELQRVKQHHFIDRAVYYVCNQIVNRAPKGKLEDENNWNYKQEPVILIALMDFELPGSSPDHYYQYIQLCDLIQNKSIYDKLTIILIELPKFAKQLVSDEMVSSLSTLEKWLYTIRNMHILDKVPQFMLEGLFKQVVEFAEVKNMNKEQRAEYERSLRDLRDEQGLRDGAFDAGWTEGEENGRRIEREIAEKKQAESIKKLLILEISTSSIANILNIDESFVFEIQKSMGAEEK